MSAHKYLEKICCVAIIISITITLLFMNADKVGIAQAEQVLGYEDTLFDTSKVHTIDLIIDDFDKFIANATDKEYVNGSVIIDGETLNNVAIRVKGNSSVSMVASSNSERYSFKIEFDHYDDTLLYNGLDKLCLNNIIQDNTYMKDYIAYNLMNEIGVPSPLTSYINVSINGEEFGLYLAVEAIEESFLQRNYGNDYGDMYKPETDDAIAGGGNPGSMGGDITGQALDYVGDDEDSYSYIFDEAVTNISDADKEDMIEAIKNISENTNLEESLDIEQVIRYFVAHNYILNFDSYTGSIMHNYYLYEEDGKLSMIPWDYNLSLNSFMTNISTEELVNFPIDTPISTGTMESRPMLSWIFENEEYTELYHQIFEEFITEVFDSGDFINMINEAEGLITSYVEADPTKFCTFEEYQLGVETLKEFTTLRAESISAQLDGIIGSTAEEQQNDTNLIDASHIEVLNMGSENMGGGGQGNRPETQGMNGQMIMPGIDGTNGQMVRPDMSGTNNQMMRPGMDGTNGQMMIPPDMEGTNGQMMIPPDMEGTNGQMMIPPDTEDTNGQMMIPPDTEDTNGQMMIPPDMEDTNGQMMIPPDMEGTNGQMTGRNPSNAQQSDSREVQGNVNINQGQMMGGGTEFTATSYFISGEIIVMLIASILALVGGLVFIFKYTKRKAF